MLLWWCCRATLHRETTHSNNTVMPDYIRPYYHYSCCRLRLKLSKV